jgi:hypothetical protein
LVVEYGTDRDRDFSWGEPAGRDLVEQRREEVVLTAVDESDPLPTTHQMARGGQAAKARSDNDYMVM